MVTVAILDIGPSATFDLCGIHMYPPEEADMLVLKKWYVFFVQFSWAAACNEATFANVQEERI